jgi:hypothetical protein
MGGGPVMRSLAALGTLGLSETAQKKPFQDLGNDNPVNSAAGGPLRFIPGGAQIAAVMGMGTDSMTPEPPTLHTMPVLGKQNENDTTHNKSSMPWRKRNGCAPAVGVASNVLTSPDDAPAKRAKKFLGGY